MMTTTTTTTSLFLSLSFFLSSLISNWARLFCSFTLSLFRLISECRESSGFFCLYFEYFCTVYDIFFQLSILFVLWYYSRARSSYLVNAVFFSSSSNSNSTWNVIDIYYFSHWFTKKSNYGSDVTSSWVGSVDSVARNFISIEDSHSAFEETCPWHGTFMHTDVITLVLSHSRLFPCYILKMWVSMFVCHRSFSSHLLVFSPFPVCIFQMQVPLSNDNSIFELQFFLYILLSVSSLVPMFFFCIMHSAGKVAFYSFNHANSRVWGAIIACWYLDRFNIRIGFVCL